MNVIKTYDELAAREKILKTLRSAFDNASAENEDQQLIDDLDESIQLFEKMINKK